MKWKCEKGRVTDNCIPRTMLGVESSAANGLIGEVVQSQRRPLLGTGGYKTLS